MCWGGRGSVVTGRSSALRQGGERVLVVGEVQPGPRDVVLAVIVDLNPPGAALLLVVDVGVHALAGLLAVRLQPRPRLGPADLLVVVLLGDAEDLVPVAAGYVLVAVRRGVPVLAVLAGRRPVQDVGGLRRLRRDRPGRVLGRHRERVAGARREAVDRQAGAVPRRRPGPGSRDRAARRPAARVDAEADRRRL